jgi:type IV secretory pathway VirB2 component (pilin)
MEECKMSMRNKINKKLMCMRAALAMAPLYLMTTNVYASGSSNGFDGVVKPIVDLLNSLMGPAMAIVGALGSLYCILLGVKFAKAEEPQEREKAKSHLKNAIIGFVLIFVLLVVLKLATPVLSDWATNSTTTTNAGDATTQTTAAP